MKLSFFAAKTDLSPKGPRQAFTLIELLVVIARWTPQTKSSTPFGTWKTD